MTDRLPSDPAHDANSDASVMRRISHDLNNLLLAIHLNLEGIRDFVPAGSGATPLIDAGAKALEEARAVLRAIKPLGSAPSPPAAGSTVPPPVAGRRRILLVEDNDLVAKSVRRTLAALGYDVVPARNAAEALEHLRSGIDLLFSDIRLSGAVDGVALAEACRAALPDLPILLTSGVPEPTGSRGPMAHAFPMIVKPYTKAELERRLRDLFAG